METIQLKNSAGKVFFTLEYDKQCDWIYAHWIGFVTVEDVIAGTEKVIHALEETKCVNFLNDNRMLTGPWNKANEWLEKNWMPRALQAGLKNLAFVTSPHIFGELSSAQWRIRLESVGFEMCNFKDYNEATKWLTNQKKVKSLK